ncbi:hypothetical protein ACVINW_003988 [Bradyrhizobium sp. USDA 4461]
MAGQRRGTSPFGTRLIVTDRNGQYQVSSQLALPNGREVNVGRGARVR